MMTKYVFFFILIIIITNAIKNEFFFFEITLISIDRKPSYEKHSIT